MIDRQTATNELVGIISATKKHIKRLESLRRPTVKEKSIRADFFMLYTQAIQLHSRIDYSDEYFIQEVERISDLYDQTRAAYHETENERGPDPSPVDPPAMVVNVPEEGQATLGLRRGGRRTGAGRKKIGETRRVSLTLPPEWWAEIDNVIESQKRSQADVIRELIRANFDE